MNSEELGIQGAWIINEQRFSDERGWFQQWFQLSSLNKELNTNFAVKQSNISKSQQGSIRGIHFSTAPEGQAKLVTVIKGAIEDFVVDIRVGSPTFGKSEKILLDEDDTRSVFIDVGLGHAFQALHSDTVIAYVLSSEYNPQLELAINPFCPTLNLDWDRSSPHLVSMKDQTAPNLAQLISENKLPQWS